MAAVASALALVYAASAHVGNLPRLCPPRMGMLQAPAVRIMAAASEDDSLEDLFARYKSPWRRAFLSPTLRGAYGQFASTLAALQRAARKTGNVFTAIPVHQQLLVANILIYVVQSAFLPTLTVAGARINRLVAGGQYHRLVTPIFLHGSPFHLLFNSLSLLSIGPVAEGTYGSGRVFVVYILGGVLGNLFGLEFGGPRPSLGASGGIFALVGALLVLARRLQQLRLGLAERLTRSLMFTIVLGLMPRERVDVTGHFGGLLGGIVLAAVLAPWDWSSRRNSASARGYVFQSPEGSGSPLLPAGLVRALVVVTLGAVVASGSCALDTALELRRASTLGFGRQTLLRILEQPPRGPGLLKYF